MLCNPVVLENKAFCPKAILFDPDELQNKAEGPIAVLLSPVVL